MARTAAGKLNYGSRQASYGNLAYDLTYEEREHLLRHAGEMTREAELPRPVSREKAQARTAVRPRVRVGALPVMGFMLAALLTLGVLQSYIQLTEISHSVVAMEQELARLKEERLALTTKYELTFDFAAIKENAEQAGMSKVSSSQIYYVDLSEPDNAVAYEQTDQNLLEQLLHSLGNGVCAAVEYFR